jgi:hypothetical protein
VGCVFSQDNWVSFRTQRSRKPLLFDLSTSPLYLFAVPATVVGADLDACVKGQTDVAKRVTDFHGESRIKQLIQADLDRAQREQAEGDADECNEAIDHANKITVNMFGSADAALVSNTKAANNTREGLLSRVVTPDGLLLSSVRP